MMFLLDIAFAVELIALGFGISMLVWAARNEGSCISVAKAFGYIIAVGAIFGMLCTSYYGFSYWSKGYFTNPSMHMMQQIGSMDAGHHNDERKQ